MESDEARFRGQTRGITGNTKGNTNLLRIAMDFNTTKAENPALFEVLLNASRNEPPDELLAKLSKQEEQIVKYLWAHPDTTKNRVKNAIWAGKDSTSDAVTKALFRLTAKLLCLRKEFGVELKVKGREVRLIRPDKT